MQTFRGRKQSKKLKNRTTAKLVSNHSDAQCNEQGCEEECQHQRKNERSIHHICHTTDSLLTGRMIRGHKYVVCLTDGKLISVKLGICFRSPDRAPMGWNARATGHGVCNILFGFWDVIYCLFTVSVVSPSDTSTLKSSPSFSECFQMQFPSQIGN